MNETNPGTDPDASARFAVTCPCCNGLIAAAVALAGRPARCPLCAGAFLVPPALLPDGGPPDAAPLPPPATAAPVADVTPAEDATPVIVSDWPRDDGRRRLTPREQATRQARRNLFMLFAGGAILLGIVLRFGGRRGRPRR